MTANHVHGRGRFRLQVRDEGHYLMRLPASIRRFFQYEAGVPYTLRGALALVKRLGPDGALAHLRKLEALRVAHDAAFFYGADHPQAASLNVPPYAAQARGRDDR